MNGLLSVIIPAYNEEEMISRTAETISGVLEQADISYELLFVNDGSKDNTWNEILKAGEKDPNILGVHFSRNFGKEAAVFAGLAQDKKVIVKDFGVFEIKKLKPRKIYDIHKNIFFMTKERTALKFKVKNGFMKKLSKKVNSCNLTDETGIK